ncbi:uncharacterized protein LOC132061646 [Lycium ferocissimum]|uniref:uncharacterized protein LOC132061646 n=1 Tax=Lycium ferocissimum TaxID=112874 RepID=UPI0028163B93|nr:uncharacterized protein LOC132061646 [Lycium ferocissimum]
MLEQHEEEEVGVTEMELDTNVHHLISSPGSISWQFQHVMDPGMFYFDLPSLPATPMEELTLWTHHHHQASVCSSSRNSAFEEYMIHTLFFCTTHGCIHSRSLFLQMLQGMIKGAVQALDAQLQEDGVAGGTLSMSDWRYELPSDSRQRMASKIIVTLGRHLPISGQEGQLELRKIAMRFEERIFTTAKSQSDYLRKISLKMLTVETKSQTPVCDESAVGQCMQLDDESLQEEPTPHNLQSEEECALLDPFPQRSVTEHGNLKRKGDTGPSGQDHAIFELGNKQKMGKRLKKTWGIGGSISLEDLKQHFGKKREEAAESLDVSISTFKRICRENGISRWPSKKIKRDRLLLSNLSSNGTVPVAGGAQIAISTTPTAFASTEVLVKSNQQKSRSSDLSLNNEIGTSLNDDVLRNNEGTDGENIMIPEGDSAPQEVLYKPQEFESTHDSLNPAYSLPDAPTILSPLPQERMQDKNSSGQLGEEIARQIEMTDGTSHLEKQYLGREILSCNTEKEVIVAVEESSSYDFRNDSEPIQDHLADFTFLQEVDKNQLISMDDFESNRVKAQSTVESKSEPCIQTYARRMKLIFEKLITLPLEDLTSPNHEASMKEALTILAGNLSLFTNEQAKQLLEFKFDFPTITYSWRDCSQSRTDCQNFLAEFEKTKSLLETATKEEEDLKDRYTQIENKEKEMMAQLEAIQKEKNEITELSRQKINQTKHLVALAEDQAGRTKEKELQMTIASAKLDKLKNQWVSLQSSFS